MINNDIVSKLKSDGAIYRCQGILECLKGNIQDKSVLDLVSKLKNDNVVILGRKISSYAIAALDILGVEKYSGEDVEIVEFIPELRECYPIKF